MRFNIITLFPEMFTGPLSESIIKRAKDKGLIEIQYHNLRDFAEDKHKTVDDTPYGGGKGMVLKVDVIDRAISFVKDQVSNITCLDSEVRLRQAKPRRVYPRQNDQKNSRTILLTPQGETFDQRKAIELSKYENIILIAGHYEGFDERVRNLVDEELSIGNFVLTGGELPAMVIIDAISRMVSGVLSEGSADSDTFMQTDKSGEYLAEYPQYTRPLEYKEMKVPDVLTSGNHNKIELWRKEKRKQKKA